MATTEVLGEFELGDEIARFSPNENAAGRRAESLVRSDGLRVVLVTMRAGSVLDEHHAPGPITIHALDGTFRVRVGEAVHALTSGGLIAIVAGARHAVEATADGAFLLTIGAAPAAPTTGC